MFTFLRPSVCVSSLDSILPQDLLRENIKGLIIDLDNTMAPWNVLEVGANVADWFELLTQHGISACVVSNNGEQRVAAVANALNIPFIYKASKPHRRAFRQAMAIMGTELHNTAVIGDQLFTDVLGGNRLGLRTFLVLPISEREWIGTKLMRLAERAVIWSLNRLEGTKVR
ncbi:MAG: YqeG family HAD IIIA-type phosphatase [Peptococcaceae bacterium]|nr:YqeG family HAD IIIA-type phosphatase [Peptococcaceae bacterium]